MANTTVINSELFTELLKQSEMALYEQSIVRSVTRLHDVPMNSGKVVSIPFWANMTSSKPGEGVAAALADTNTTSKTVTLEEHVWNGKVTDFLRDTAQEQVIATMAAQAGYAIGEGFDKELINLFSNVGITQSVGAANADSTVADLMKAAAIIRSNKYSGPLFAVISPMQALGIKLGLTATNSFQNASSVANTALSQYFVGSIAGITILEHALITADGSGDAVGCVFAPDAFVFSQRGGISMELQRQARERATDVVLTGVCGAGLYRPELAVKFVGDSTVA